MKEKDFLDEKVSFEDELVEIARPALRHRASQNAGEWKALELIRYLWRRPQFCVGESRVPLFQSPDMQLGRCNYTDRYSSVGTKIMPGSIANLRYLNKNSE
jgi:hypothetical protein